MAGGTQNYMMRTEKRSGRSQHPNPADKKRRDRKRKPRAGFFYIFFTLIFLIILWPVGVIMLWRRKLQWGFTTKLLLMLASLCIVILAGAFALTKDTGDPQITAMQDRANDVIETSVQSLTHASKLLGERGREAFEVSKSVADGAGRYSLALMADGIEYGLEAVEPLRTFVEDKIGRPVALSTATPVPTEEPTAEPTAEPTVKPTAKPTDVPTPQATVTSSPEAKAAVASEETTEAPTKEATEEPTEKPTPEPTEAPTEEPTPEPTPTPEIVHPSVTLKPAGEATVYHSSNGKYYHSVQKCKGMSGSKAYTLADCVNGYKACNTCKAPQKELVDKMCLWQDKDGLCHTSDTCTAFKGSYTLIERDEALEKGCKGCTACGADEYLRPNTVIGE